MKKKKSQKKLVVSHFLVYFPRFFPVSESPLKSEPRFDPAGNPRDRLLIQSDRILHLTASFSSVSAKHRMANVRYPSDLTMYSICLRHPETRQILTNFVAFLAERAEAAGSINWQCRAKPKRIVQNYRP